jgi:hypothetical protein
VPPPPHLSLVRMFVGCSGMLVSVLVVLVGRLGVLLRLFHGPPFSQITLTEVGDRILPVASRRSPFAE